MSTFYLQQDQEDLAIHYVPLSQEDLWAPYHQALPYHLECLVGPAKKEKDIRDLFRQVILSFQQILCNLFTKVTQDMQKSKSCVQATLLSISLAELSVMLARIS